MTHDNDFIGQLEDYLHEFDGVTPLPGRVRDAIRAELPSVRQAQHRPAPRRLLTMLSTASAGARLGLAAAVVVVAVVLGAAVLNNGQNRSFVGDTPTPTPSPTPAPSATLAPSPTAAPSGPALIPPLDQVQYVACNAADTGKNCLPAGTYQLSGPSSWPIQVTVDLPAGWFEWSGGSGWDAVLVTDPDGSGASAGSGWGAMFYTVGDVARDPCDQTKGWTPGSQLDTPQKLAAAMGAWPQFKTTTPQAISVDGHSGLKFRLTSTAKSSCGGGSAGHTTVGTLVDVYPTVGGDPSTVWIVDTGSGLLVIRATEDPRTSPAEVGGGRSPDPTFHAGDLAALHAILDSIRIHTPSS